ncbi:hypothetical protein ACJQ40_001962 [Enterococcus faecium]|nr:hypothetical protein [Enterococcus faecium]
MIYEPERLYGFNYNPINNQPYWLNLVNSNSMNPLSEYLILCFPTKNGFIVGEFLEEQSNFTLSDKIIELYSEEFPHSILFPLIDNEPMIFTFKTEFDKSQLINFFRQLAVPVDYLKIPKRAL